jgi:Glyoxalase/Bleomycin resistance protein/Dioxygenase superfamily
MTRPAHPLFEQSWPEGEFRFFQLGFLVADLFEAMEHWTRVYGVGPFHVIPEVDQLMASHGSPATVTMRVGVAQAGPVQIELLEQLCDRPSIFQDWHRGRISGLHQICTVTPDYDGRKAHYESLGYELAAETTNLSFRVAYYDTSADFGFFTEVVEETPGFMRQLDRMSAISASWDGVDPVRILTRTGYEVPARP